jgi:hypothetical protein
MDYSLLVGIHELPKNDPGYIENLTVAEDSEPEFKNGFKKPIHRDFRGGVLS